MAAVSAWGQSGRILYTHFRGTRSADPGNVTINMTRACSVRISELNWSNINTASPFLGLVATTPSAQAEKGPRSSILPIHSLAWKYMSLQSMSCLQYIWIVILRECNGSLVCIQWASASKAQDSIQMSKSPCKQDQIDRAEHSFNHDWMMQCYHDFCRNLNSDTSILGTFRQACSGSRCKMTHGQHKR